MRHRSSTELLSYWDMLRGTARAPERMALEPKRIAGILPDLFILDTSVSPARFRLAGTRACEAHMKELKGTSFADLWTENDRRQIETVVEMAGRDMVGVLIGSRASTERNEEISFETLMLPLAVGGDSGLRAVGSISAHGRPWSLGSFRLGPHSIVSMRMLTEGNTSPSTLRAAGLTDGGETPVIDFSRRGRVPSGMNARKVRHLLVIEGGAERL